MGKGDKKSRRGKIRIGSSGVRRPRKKKRAGHISVQVSVQKPAEVVVEEKPVVTLPEVEASVAEEPKPAPVKAKQKKSPVKKIAEKPESEEPKPKTSKPKKKET